MAEDGRAVSPNEAAHHIVAAGSGRSAPARSRLVAENIEINDAVNGADLLWRSSISYPNNLPARSKIHINSYYDHINKVIESAPSGMVRNMLNAIRKQIFKNNKE